MASIRYLLALLIAVAVAHVVWSAAVVGGLRSVFVHRVPNLATMTENGPEREVIGSAFVVETHISAQRERKPLMMFLGSSLTWGYPWQQDVIYTRIVADRLIGWKVVNMSMLAIGTRGITDFMTCALGPARRPETLIVELPLVNSVSSTKLDVRHAPRSCARPGPAATGYWPLVLARPRGLGWLAALWDDEAYDKPEEQLRVARVPPGYFVDRQAFAPLERRFVNELRRFLTEIATKGDKVYVYVSPIYTPAIEEAGGDRRSVEAQIDLVNQVCQEVKAVVCLDTRPFGTRKELFYNLTHLNQWGHRVLADWFVEQVALRSPGRSKP
jgi:hypothetical protein